MGSEGSPAQSVPGLQQSLALWPDRLSLIVEMFLVLFLFLCSHFSTIMYIHIHYISYIFKYSSTFSLLGKEERVVLPRQAVCVPGGGCRCNRRSTATWQVVSPYYGLGRGVAGSVSSSGGGSLPSCVEPAYCTLLGTKCCHCHET